MASKQIFLTMLIRPQRATAGFFLHLCCVGGLLFSGCIAPIPMTKRTSAPAGTQEKKRMDITFIQSGKTTRDEVVQRLSWASSGINEPHLFLARWASSGSGWLWFPGLEGCEPLPFCREEGAYRNWTVHNAIVEFDNGGVVRNVRDVPSPEPAGSLDACAALDSSHSDKKPTSVELSAYQLHPHSPIATVKLVLSADSFEYQDLKKPTRNFGLCPYAIRGISSGSEKRAESVSTLNQAKVNLAFREKTPVGKHISFEALPPDLLVLVRYLHAANGAPHAP